MIQKTLTIEVVCLFCCLTIVSDILAVSNESLIPLSVRSGTTLFVGGSGPGNYTTIQDAVNAAVDGDTIFVYNRNFYLENILINSSISLIGENNSVTVEAKNRSLPTIRIIHDSVKIQGFHIDYLLGCDNYSWNGIRVENASNITISHGHFDTYETSIYFNNVKNSSIQYTSYTVQTHRGAVVLSASSGNLIQNNYFDNFWGVDLILETNSSDNIVQKNNFTWRCDNQPLAIGLWQAGPGNKILHNNILCLVRSTVYARWFQNYYAWMDSNFYRHIHPFFLPKIIFPACNIDWLPARYPYDLWSPYP